MADDYRPRTDPDTGVTFLEPETTESPYSWDYHPYLPSSPEPSVVEQVRGLLDEETVTYEGPAPS